MTAHAVVTFVAGLVIGAGAGAALMGVAAAVLLRRHRLTIGVDLDDPPT